MPLKLYCEPGALTKELRSLQSEGLVRLVHFSFDPGSITKKISHEASPAGALWKDLGLTWKQLNDLGVTWADLDVRGRIAEIEGIIGPNHRRDVLHVNSAYVTGCPAMVTRDSDILSHRSALEALLSVKFFHPDEDAGGLLAFVSSPRAV